MDQRDSRSPSRSPVDDEKKDVDGKSNGGATNSSNGSNANGGSATNTNSDTVMKDDSNNSNNNNGTNSNNSNNNNNNNNNRGSRSPSPRGRRGDSKERSKSRDRNDRDRSRDRDRDRHDRDRSRDKYDKHDRERSRERNRSRTRSRSGSRRRKSIDFSLLAERRVYVGRISNKTTRESLEDSFLKFGKVLSCDVKNGYAFVEFDNEKSARDAIEEMHDTIVDGEKILVEKSHSGKKHPDECFICRGRGHWARSCPKGGSTLEVTRKA
ncbi:hypothetical protein ACTA71_009157 [Dictyostelium dimigraforme]